MMTTEYDEHHAGNTSDQAAAPTSDYVVGRGKPPRETQFPKGKSGNPKGRPKKTIDLRTSFNEMMDERDVFANGRTMAKGEALVRQIFHDAGKCDQKAFGNFLKLAIKAGLLNRPDASSAVPAAQATFLDMPAFDADFGKPLPTSDEPEDAEMTTTEEKISER